jgi:hypothetical protein
MGIIRGPLGWVVAGGLLAGAFDMAYACIYWAIAADVPAQRIFQSVARGLLGKAAFEGGWGTALLGLALHFFMTLVMAGVYFAASRRIPALWQRPLAGGAAYGLGIYGVMNYVVVPLSAAAGPLPGNTLWTWLSVAMHMLIVGIPIALCVSRAHPRPSARTA